MADALSENQNILCWCLQLRAIERRTTTAPEYYQCVVTARHETKIWALKRQNHVLVTAISGSRTYLRC